MRSELDELHALADAVLLPSFEGPTLPDLWFERLSSGLGGITLFATNVGTPEQVRELTARIHEANPDAVIAVDEEGGDVTRLQWAHGSSYPGNLALGRVNDVGLTRQLGEAIGADLARAGIDLNLAPSVDVNCEPDNPVIGVRSFGADPGQVSAHAAAWIAGHQARGVAACAKHFPGHGATTTDSHHDLPRLEVEREVLEPRELAPFRAAVAAGVRAVMTAHIVVSAVDAAAPVTLSRPALIGLLRGELGFDGLIVSDALDMAAIAATYGMPQGAVRALAAGVDALCLGPGASPAQVEGARTAIVEALRDGVLPVVRLAEASRRLRDLARWSSRMRRPSTGPDEVAGLAAARRAITVSGTPVGPMPGPPLVVELDGRPNMAAGERLTRGLGDLLSALLPGTLVRRVGIHQDGTDLGHHLLADAAGRALVIVVRELHREPRVARVVDELRTARPDAIVVETGFPGPDSRHDAEHPDAEPGSLTWRGARVFTFGSAPVCLRAAAEVLAQRGR